MKIAQINATLTKGSTGTICQNISSLLDEAKVTNCIFYSYDGIESSQAIRFSTYMEVKASALMARLLGNWGFNNYPSTKRLLGKLEKFKPDIVHLHNIHGHNCDIKLLFEFLLKKQIPVIWSFHDCWAFTGYCVHYDMIGCQKWRCECSNCPQKNVYSWLFDRSHKLFHDKKKLMTELDLTIVTPSEWLASQVAESFLKNKSVRVINNGIDISLFSPYESTFRDKYCIRSKYIILGVAFGWSEKKGFDVFLNLSKSLSDDYQIVLVGTDEKVDKVLDDRIISIHKTQNQKELCEIYTAADVFINPTREENYPTVNMEALACGTPVITFNTGGSAEIIDSSCGVAVEKNDIESMKRAIIRVCEGKAFTKEACLKRAESFDMHKRFQEYIDLYNEVAHDRTSKG